jgi:hypothetical protein
MKVKSYIRWVQGLALAAFTCQSARDNLNVDVAMTQIDWASVALEALDKGACCIIR